MAVNSARIELAPKLVPVFEGKARYRGAYGGRGSSKTRGFATMTAVFGYRWGCEGKSGVILCGREFQNSLDESSMEEIKAAIREVPWLNAYYEIGERYIRSRDGKIKYVFTGLRHNLDSVKSKAKVLLCWIDEAEPVSEAAWRKLIPTVREDNSEIWLTWNRESEDSATNKRFFLNPPDGAKIVELNYTDNPWFPDVLDQERLHDKEYNNDMYDHVWEGECITNSDAQILANKYEEREFEPEEDWDGPYYGLDFGFAADPTAGVKCWTHEKILYVEYEAVKHRLEIDDHAEFLLGEIPGIESGIIKADCARPETISFLARNGLPLIRSCVKYKITDGISHLRSYKKIVIHPRCESVLQECRLYSYKVDRVTDEVLPVIIDKHNHCMDAIRYALEIQIGTGLKGFKTNSRQAEEDNTDPWGRPVSEESNAWLA